MGFVTTKQTLYQCFRIKKIDWGWTYFLTYIEGLEPLRVSRQPVIILVIAFILVLVLVILQFPPRAARVVRQTAVLSPPPRALQQLDMKVTQTKTEWQLEAHLSIAY